MLMLLRAYAHQALLTRGPYCPFLTKNEQLGLEPLDFVRLFGNLNALPMRHYAGLSVTLYQRRCLICRQICWLRAGLEWHIFFRDAGRGSGEFRLQQ